MERIAFNISQLALSRLRRMARKGKFESLGEVVGVSLEIHRALQEHARHGFTEVVLRNPRTERERVMTIAKL